MFEGKVQLPGNLVEVVRQFWDEYVTVLGMEGRQRCRQRRWEKPAVKVWKINVNGSFVGKPGGGGCCVGKGQ